MSHFKEKHSTRKPRLISSLFLATLLVGCASTTADDWSDYTTPACGGLFMAEARYHAVNGNLDEDLMALAQGYFAAGQRILGVDIASIQTLGSEFEPEYFEELQETSGQGGQEYVNTRSECLTFGAMQPETRGLLP